RVAVVTGGASGIGRACAEVLARDGAEVVVADVDAAGAEVAAAIGGKYVRLDVTDEAAWQGLIDSLSSLDGLVDKAGSAIGRPVTELTAEEWHRVLAVNLDGVFYGTKHAVRAMRRSGRGGAIINMSSAAGLVGTPGASAYAASKGAVRLFTKAVALECAKDG